MANEFKPGDVVQLKSGGPRMTVTDVGEAFGSTKPRVWCEWFDGPKKNSDNFTPEALKHSSE